MIHWIFLIASVFSNAVKGFSTKRISGEFSTLSDNISVNIYRNAFCAGLGFLYLNLFGGNLKLQLEALIICAVAGASMAAFLMAYLYSVRSGAYMMVSAFTSASFIVPFIGALIFLDEKLSFKKLAAVGIMCVAMYLLCLYNNKIKVKLNFKSLAVLVGVTVFYGISQFTQKLYVLKTDGENTTAYTFYMFLFAVVTLLIMKLFTLKSKEKSTGCLKKPRVIIYASSAALALYLVTYFQTVAAKGISATVMYPVVNGLTLVAGTLMSVFFFGEKLKKESIAGIVLVFIAMIL